MRVTSLFPAATEIAFALGAGNDMAGVSHACDYPDKVERIKKMTMPRFDPTGLSSRDIYDQKVETIRQFGSLYRLSETELWGARSDVLLTQGPGDFSLVSLQGVRTIAEGLNPRPKLVILYPRHLDDVIEDHLRVGFEIGRMQQARTVSEKFYNRVDKVTRETEPAGKRRNVAFIQWLDPAFSGGYWVTQLIEAAGGRDCFGSAGLPPSRVRWRDLVEHDPEVLIMACEDMHVDALREEIHLLTDQPEWYRLLAVRKRRAYIGSGVYFTRSGPRLLYGLDALAWAIQPELFPEPPKHVLQRLGT